jgi:cellulase/cellobiase CelA1
MLMRKNRVGQVIFKLDDPYLEQLEKSAKALGMRPNLYARRLVVQSLMNIQLERMEYRLDMMQEGIAAGFEQMLTQFFMTQDKIGNVTSKIEDSTYEQTEEEEDEVLNIAKRDAKAWVDEHIRHETDEG